MGLFLEQVLNAVQLGLTLFMVAAGLTFRVRPAACLPRPALLSPGRRHPRFRQAGGARVLREDVRHLVEYVWNKGGKLILDGAFGIPDQTPVANVRAMFDSARKYAG
jgi:hypothetical protein